MKIDFKPTFYRFLDTIRSFAFSTKRRKLISFGLLILLLFIGFMKYRVSTRFECISGDCNTGFAKMKFRGGDYYEGYVLGSRPHGLGLFKNENGDMYRGEWRNGLK